MITTVETTDIPKKVKPKFKKLEEPEPIKEESLVSTMKLDEKKP